VSADLRPEFWEVPRGFSRLVLGPIGQSKMMF
jgi:hypothetical protein